MKIIYKQPQNTKLSNFGIESCYFKELMPDRDSKNITKKVHHHTGFELHMIIDGEQTYETENTVYRLEKGSFLLVPPNIPHRVINSLPQTKKYSVTFYMQTENKISCITDKFTERMHSNICFIVNEAANKKEISYTLMENSILEIIVFALRLAGIEEKPQNQVTEENAVLSLAKQYIKENTEQPLNVSDVSDYCCLSEKQITRIFNYFEGISPSEYIKLCRVKYIEKLLCNSTLSIKEISDKMNFSSEYYFNTFFKKYSGMPPGEYRKTLTK